MANITNEQSKDGAQPPAPKRPMVTPVINNEARVRMIQLPGKRIEVSNTIAPGPLLRLIPGAQLVETSLWAVARVNPGVKILFTERVGRGASPEAQVNSENFGKPILVERAPLDAANPIGAMSEEDALSFAEECFDTDLLRRFLKTEDRGSVRTAIDRAIETIEKPASKRSQR